MLAVWEVGDSNPGSSTSVVVAMVGDSEVGGSGSGSLAAVVV